LGELSGGGVEPPARELCRGEPARARTGIARRDQRVLGERLLGVVEARGPEQALARRGVERELEADARRLRRAELAAASLAVAVDGAREQRGRAELVRHHGRERGAVFARDRL